MRQNAGPEDSTSNKVISSSTCERARSSDYRRINNLRFRRSVTNCGVIEMMDARRTDLRHLRRTPVCSFLHP